MFSTLESGEKLSEVVTPKPEANAQRHTSTAHSRSPKRARNDMRAARGERTETSNYEFAAVLFWYLALDLVFFLQLSHDTARNNQCRV